MKKPELAASMRRVGWRDHAVGAGLCVVYVAILLATAGDLAMSRDESTYVMAAERYAGWLEQVADDPTAALSEEAVDRGWGFNQEHPPLMKTLFGLSWLAHRDWHVFSRDSTAFRFPGMLSAGLLLWLIYIFGAQARSRAVGAFGAAAFALVPHVFYHAHLNAFDVPIALMIAVTTYAYWRSLTDRGWALWAGLLFGFALATKHNAWILPGVLLIHWLWAFAGELRARRRGRGRAISLVPWWLPSLAILGPLVFYATWPWIWHHTQERVDEYVSFHLHHVHYHYTYLGTTYFQPPFPIHVSWVQTLFTVPFATLALALAGLALRWRALTPPGLERFWRARAGCPDRAFTDVLWLGSLVAPYVVMSLPSTPIFGGTKHWFTAYPFLMLFAGVAFERVVRIAFITLHRLRARRRRFGRAMPRAAPYIVPVAVAALLLSPAIAGTAHAHPFGLSYYGVAAGGVPGAADLGMNRQFWGYTTGSLAGWFREHLPSGGSVWLCDMTFEAWRMMQRDEMIPDTIRPASTIQTADYAIVHHEHHFVEVDYQIWEAYGAVAPVYVLLYDGVPIISVYENPRHARARRGGMGFTHGGAR